MDWIDSLVGKDFVLAVNEVGASTDKLRIIKFNGEGYPYFENYDSSRVNLYIKDFKVERVERG